MVVPRKMIAGTIALLFAGLGIAAAHGMLTRAVPPAGSTVTKAPAEVSLWFSERLEPAFSRAEVVDAAGQRVDKDDSHVAPDDPRRLTVGLVPLKPGAYKVIWRVLSVDTHRTNGEYSFAVAE
jgi:methionine-rich copper-binding protein CopC